MLLLVLQIIPADLNAFLYQMETNIAWAAGQLGDEATRTKFEQAANTRRNSINQVLWDNASGGVGWLRGEQQASHARA